MHPEVRVDHGAEALIEREHVLVRAADDPPRPERACDRERRAGDDLDEGALAVARPDPRPAQLDERRRRARDRLADRTAIAERQFDRQRRPRPAQVHPHAPVRPTLLVAGQHDPREAQIADPKATVPQVAAQALGLAGAIEGDEIGPLGGDERLDGHVLKLRGTDRSSRHLLRSSG
ncbi:MAG TPA: hypothetical protein VIK91_14295 [Nannocystis sp.]